MRLVWSIVVLVIVVLVGVWGYQQYQAGQQETPGHVTWVHGQPTPEAKAAFDRKNSGYDDSGADASSTSNAPAYPSSGAAKVTSPAATTPVQSAAYTQPDRSPAPANLPRTDSQPPVPPNGEAYRGTGVYELYRQGNLTYRMDTATGRTCVAFATMEEWRKPVVMRNGCGRTS
jgi:cytoskeletal protein RodZ